MSEPRLGSGVFVAASLVAAASLALAPSCLERRGTLDRSTDEQRCTGCHGDPARDGSFLDRSAPPFDLWGRTTTASPGVGAHAIHLTPGATHAAIACDECHAIPDHVDSPGHADSARPAELSFGPLARTGGTSPAYDPVARTCSGTWCHRDADAVWTEPKSSEQACGSCHGLPPPLPHPQSERCSVCHDRTVDAAGRIIEPALHVNGRVEVASGACSACHGEGDRAAPPVDTTGATSPRAIGVGAHEAHLTGGEFGRPLECSECHRVPEHADDPDHADGLPAEVRFTGVAATDGREPTWNRETRRCVDAWCHAPSPEDLRPSPDWTDPGERSCSSCHGLPPPLPHPQSDRCSACHGEVVDAARTIIDRDRHVDGVVDVHVEPSCTSCHGDVDAAPPPDVSGGEAPTLPGVGAHRTHVTGTSRSRAVPCGECHVVPEEPLAAGHLDSAGPAEVVFSGVATAFGAAPAYENGRCENSACHGAVFPHGHRSGGSNTTPIWTRADGTQAACGSCHGLPPPPPHPYGALNPDCSRCHENVAPDNVSFVRPDLHVDGVVTFTLP